MVTPTQAVMRLIGAAPTLFHTDPERVFLVGCLFPLFFKLHYSSQLVPIVAFLSVSPGLASSAPLLPLFLPASVARIAMPHEGGSS